MSETIDARWLFAHDAAYFDTWGQRMDVAGVARWSAPELSRLRSANHAAIGPDGVVIPDQLVQVFDRQRRDGARRRCIDLYGSVDDRDAMLAAYGMRRESDAATVVIVWRREQTHLPPLSDGVDRPAPIPEPIAPEDWLDVVAQTRGGALADWELAVLRHQASIPCARFYGIRIGDNAVACCARYDLPDASRVDTLHVDQDFRGTGFGRATLARTIREAPVDRIYGTFDDANLAMAAVGQRLGGAIVLRDVVRRFVGKWEDTP